ncbi:hypothetical protein GGR51DRAFT_268516 [Nemania sp. FL0031]|nr:hypothetical protein GGR51DRAFT_268516 [Nemania sp. FL0031]
MESPRDLGHRPLAADFIDTRLQEYHPAFRDPPVYFDPIAQRYVPSSPVAAMYPASRRTQLGTLATSPPRPVTAEVNSMTFWDRIFPDAMRMFKKDHPQEPSGRESRGYSMRKENWRDVNAQLDKARRSYEGKKGSLGFLKLRTRKVLENFAYPAQIATKVIPNGDISSPVLGVIEILVDAIRKAGDTRDAVLTKVDNLQQTFEVIEVFTTIYPNDQNITGASIKLVSTILKAVEDVIGYFTEDQFKKAGIAILAGDQYQKSLKQSLDSIDDDSQSLLNQAQFSNAHIITQILRNTTESIEIQERMTNSMMDLFQEMSKENKLLHYQNGFLQGQVQALSRPASPGSSDTPREPKISQEMLFTLLDIPDIHLEDLNHILWNRGRIHMREQERAQQLINQHQFRQWAIAQTSVRLLVHGDFDAGGDLQDFSALSIFTATFANVMREATADSASSFPTGRLFSLVFFCGLHTRIFHDFVGPKWMIRSLIAQLLCQGIAFDTTGLEDDVDINGVIASDVIALCHLFVWLCHQIPPEVTLFVLVDGIVFFERPDYAFEMGFVLRVVLDMVEDESVQSRIKVLITSPIGTRIVRKYYAFINGESTISTDGLQGVNASSTRRLEREIDEEIHSTSVGH